jgi:putative (di)nucleoside polyphosphate hydrolase
VTDLIDRDGFRANVGIVLMSDTREVLLARRIGNRGWQFPQGGIRRGEPVEDALLRELAEELGLGAADVTVLGSTRGWMRYRLPARFVRRDQHPVCIGQKQRWFLLRSHSREPKVDFHSTSEPEFDQWRWASWWEPLREVIPFKRQVYRRALHELGEYAFPEGLPALPGALEQELAAEAAEAGTAAT